MKKAFFSSWSKPLKVFLKEEKPNNKWRYISIIHTAMDHRNLGELDQSNRYLNTFIDKKSSNNTYHIDYLYTAIVIKFFNNYNEIYETVKHRGVISSSTLITNAIREGESLLISNSKLINTLYKDELNTCINTLYSLSARR